MSAIVTAIVPVVVLLVLGWALRRFVLRDVPMWRGLEHLTYFVFTPALFVDAIAGVDLGTVPVGPIALAVIVPVVVVSAVLVVCRRLLRLDGPALTSMIQGSVRLNTYIGLSLVSALHGTQGVATFAVAAAIMVPTVNVVCVSALTIYGASDDDTARDSLPKSLATNPLVLGCLAGIAINLSGVTLPAVADATIAAVAAPTLACGTMVAGASIVAGSRRGDLGRVAVSSVLKFVALPLGATGIAAGLGVGGVALDSVVVITALPTATSSYILSVRMGGDSKLMSSITVVQTVLALATIPVTLAVLGA